MCFIVALSQGGTPLQPLQPFNLCFSYLFFSPFIHRSFIAIESESTAAPNHPFGGTGGTWQNQYFGGFNIYLI